MSAIELAHHGPLTDAEEDIADLCAFTISRPETSSLKLEGLTSYYYLEMATCGQN